MLDTRTTNGHSLISPSGASRWAYCAGSVRLTMNDKDTTSEAAQRGTDIHQLGEGMLNGKEYITNSSVIRDGEHEEGMFYAGKPMIEEASAYHDYVRALMVGPHSELFVESKVDILPQYDVSGHVDACVIDETVLHVIDLKTGRGPVSAENNSQMMMYAIGLYDEHEMFYDIEKIHLHIVQDNDYVHNTNSWECSVDDILDFKAWITERARLALQEDSVCTPSQSACQWCSHAPKCKALYDLSKDIVTGEFENIEDVETAVDNAEVVSMEDVLNLLKHKKLIDNLFKAYDQRVFDILNSGEKVEGYKLVLGRKNKKWINETEAYAKLKSWMPKAEFDEYLNIKLCTPTQANKLIKGTDISAKKANIFDSLYEVPQGEPQIAPSSDKRPEYVPVAEFDDLGEEL